MGAPLHKMIDCFFSGPIVRGEEVGEEGEGVMRQSEGSFAFTSLLCAGSQQVNHVQMVANVGQDLELSHQSFVLAGCGPLCVRSKEESGPQDNGAPSAGGGIPAFLVCKCSTGCFINFPTFCKKASSPDCFHYSYHPQPTSF
jgi:hypothetical protein